MLIQFKKERLFTSVNNGINDDLIYIIKDLSFIIGL